MGARTLAVRPMDDDRMPLVRQVVAELVGAEPTVKGRLVTAPVTDPAVLPALVRRLDEAGVLVTELALRGSSLNDVFLTLTGRPAEEEAGQGESDRA
jgi:oleandomycin transport system ATP-binding protein